MSCNHHYQSMKYLSYLFDEAQLLSLALVQPRLDRIRLFQPLQREDEQLCVVLVGEWWEWDGGEPPRLQPVHRGRVDGDCLLGRDVGPVLQVVVLPLLLGLQVEPGQAAEVLLAHRLVNRGAPVKYIKVVLQEVCQVISRMKAARFASAVQFFHDQDHDWKAMMFRSLVPSAERPCYSHVSRPRPPTFRGGFNTPAQFIIDSFSKPTIC